MQTKIKYNINWYKPEEETIQWEKVRNQKVIKVEPKGNEERNKFGDLRDWNPSTHKGEGLFKERNDHWGECSNCNLNAYLK